MPESILYAQWRDVNGEVKYPFSAGASMTNGEVSIPQESFIDARIYPPGGSDTLHLSRVVKDGTTLKFVIGDDVLGDLATAEVVIADIVTYSVELLELRDLYNRVAGVLVTEPARLGLLASLPIGTHTFSSDETAFASSVVSPAPKAGLKSVVVDGQPVYGDVWLVGGLGVVLQHSTGAVHGDDVITINVVGEPLSARAVCQDASVGFSPPSFLEYMVVNGTPVHPDDFGDIKIGVCGLDVDDTVLRVIPGDDGLTFAAVGGRVG